MTKIVQRDHPVLHQPALPIAPAEIGSPEMKKLLVKMSATLAAEPDGIALAASQLGVGKRLFIVSPRIFGKETSHQKKDLVFINPRLIKLAKKKVLMEEGCLSVRWLYGNVLRAEKASIEAQDEYGKKFTRHGTGLMAQIFQHELDHLNGVLFSERARDLREVPPEKKPDD